VHTEHFPDDVAVVDFPQVADLEVVSREEGCSGGGADQVVPRGGAVRRLGEADVEPSERRNDDRSQVPNFNLDAVDGSRAGSHGDVLSSQPDIPALRREGIVHVKEVETAEDILIVSQRDVRITSELLGYSAVAEGGEPARLVDLRRADFQILHDVALIVVLERVRVPEVLRGALEPEIRREGIPWAEKKQEKKDRDGPLCSTHYGHTPLPGNHLSEEDLPPPPPNRSPLIGNRFRNRQDRTFPIRYGEQ
jgi:hypothetical protein